MYWANFLHIYQPADQQPDILEEVVTESYRPIMRGLKDHSKVHLTLNINGALIELFDKHGYRDLIDDLRMLGKEGRVEFTSSAKYHAFLPFLERNEIIRQITENDKTNKFFLGEGYNPKGFFPPEMAYSEHLPRLIEELGYKWVILDEIAKDGAVGKVDYTKIYKIKGTNLNVFFRERRISNLIMSAVVRSAASLKKAISDDIKSGRYILTAMDGETFGHHRPGLEKLLFQLFETKGIDLIKISDIPKYFQTTEEIDPIKSTWASSEYDIERGVQFLSWLDPNNEIHKWQWEFTDLVLREAQALKTSQTDYQKIRQKVDKALASDQYWWASAKPWWSLEMIEDGAFRLLEIARSIPDMEEKKLDRVRTLYEKIVSTAFQWQRTGKIRQMAKSQQAVLRIPFKERTLERGGDEQGVYFAFVDMMKKLEKKATKQGNYEEAILWRDAIYKLENKHDIYDAVNAIDLLRVKIPHEEVELTIEKYKEKYRKIRGGQPEQRGS